VAQAVLMMLRASLDVRRRCKFLRETILRCRKKRLMICAPQHIELPDGFPSQSQFPQRNLEAPSPRRGFFLLDQEVRTEAHATMYPAELRLLAHDVERIEKRFGTPLRFSKHPYVSARRL
jgi:hypothetical protein